MSDLFLRNSNNPFVVDSLQMRVDYAGGDNAIYIGRAKPGQLTSDKTWQIRRLAWDANNNITSVTFANGAADFNCIWDNRDTDYDYK